MCEKVIESFFSAYRENFPSLSEAVPLSGAIILTSDIGSLV